MVELIPQSSAARDSYPCTVAANNECALVSFETKIDGTVLVAKNRRSYSDVLLHLSLLYSTTVSSRSFLIPSQGYATSAADFVAAKTRFRHGGSEG